jgi:RNA polymerase sigma factor (sigma-70 family)
MPVSTGSDEELNDGELAGRASAGDRDALATLVTRAACKGAREAQGKLVQVIRPGIQEHIRRYLAQRCPPSTVASWLEDLTQDAVVRVLLGLGNLRGEVWPWALSIARNTACERLRAEIAMRRLKEALRSMSDGLIEPVDPREETSAAREHEELAEYLRLACESVAAELDGLQRRAFVLRLEGRAPKEIAKILHVNPQSVYNWKHRHLRMVVARCAELSEKDPGR